MSQVRLQTADEFLNLSLPPSFSLPRSLSLSLPHIHTAPTKQCILGLVVHLHEYATVIGRASLSPVQDDATHNPLRGAAIGRRAVREFRRPTARRTIAKYDHVCSGSSALLVPAGSEPSCVNHHHVSRRRHVRGAVMKGGTEQRHRRTEEYYGYVYMQE